MTQIPLTIYGEIENHLKHEIDYALRPRSQPFLAYSRVSYPIFRKSGLGTLIILFIDNHMNSFINRKNFLKI